MLKIDPLIFFLIKLNFLNLYCFLFKLTNFSDLIESRVVPLFWREGAPCLYIAGMIYFCVV